MDNPPKIAPKKLNNISLLRLLSCLGIFAYHYTSFYITPAIDYYMPSAFLVFTFALLSAFLYSSKAIDNPKDWLKKNFLKLLIPMLTYVGMAVVLLIVVGLIVYQGDFGAVFSNFIGYNPSNDGINFVFGNLWFLGILLLCYIATPFCYRFVSGSFSKKGKIIFIIVIPLICIVEVLFNFFCPVFTVYIASYFIGRKIFSPICKEAPSKKHLPLVLGALAVLIGSALLWYLVVGKMAGGYTEFGVKALQYLVFFAVALSFSCVFLYCFKFLNRWNIPLFGITDKYSFPFYMAHQLYMVGTLCFYQLIPTWYFVPLFFLTAATAFLISLVSGIFVKKALGDKKKEPIAPKEEVKENPGA